MAKKPTAPISNPIAPEIYADRASAVALRGNVARITLASERTSEDTADAEAVVAGHIALSVKGFLHLYAQMQSVVSQMEANGLIKRPDAGAEKSAKSTAKGTSKRASKTAKKSARRKTSQTKNT